MALSISNQVMILISLALVVITLMPRIFGGAGEGKQAQHRVPPGLHSRAGQGKVVLPTEQQLRVSNKVKSEMEEEMKNEKISGRSRSMAFTLMPFYAIGVALFAAFKFTKLNTQENNQTKLEEVSNENTKETENQLLELERHLSQTEQMLNSLLLQLDPLSQCVNTLANEQKEEIMTQLQYIRQLMKKSGMDKSPSIISDNENLKDLIGSFKEQSSALSDQNEDGNEKEKHLAKTDKRKRIHYNDIIEEECNDTIDSLGVVESYSDHLNKGGMVFKGEGLRKRNVKD
ncbi:hypothetical protein GDO86_005755 [Hymenochirus boettgeri]|uniref:Resistance to inhibitors of cholinesterase protein 3 N-terminal domain-containing protein n=1 Tax=Hymenochirus boettgeri TaxID=247094 RepID=A0A8T2J3A4_9PIPI|nr:hypothetical protein GDO86_005755 [Hymenochirus boettgeri]